MQKNRGIALIIIAAFIPLLSSCSNPEQANTCNWKSDGLLGPVLPVGATNQRYSPLSNKLAFLDGEVGIADIHTGAVTYVNPFQNIGDSLVPAFIDAVDWCPYDGNKLIVIVTLGAKYDTVNTGRTGLLFLHADGSFDTLLIFGWSATYIAWLVSSRQFIDSLVFQYVPAGAGGLKSFAAFATYCPETGTFSNPQPSSTPTVLRETSKHNFSYEEFSNSGQYQNLYLLDGKVVNWGDPKPTVIGSASFSPDEKHLAIWNWNALNGTSEEWIYDVDAMLSGAPVSPISRLNFVNLYCLGSALGIWGEFVSDTSLVVSLHGDPTTGAQSNLYEVNFSGGIIRQLTFDH